MITYTDIGNAIAQLTSSPDASNWNNELVLVQPDSVSDNGNCTPAKSFTVWGKPSILKLRDLLNQAYPPEESK